MKTRKMPQELPFVLAIIMIGAAFILLGLPDVLDTNYSIRVNGNTFQKPNDIILEYDVINGLFTASDNVTFSYTIDSGSYKKIEFGSIPFNGARSGSATIKTGDLTPGNHTIYTRLTYLNQGYHAKTLTLKIDVLD